MQFKNRQAIYLNNQAVEYLQTGKTMEALHTLQDALPLTVHHPSQGGHSQNSSGVYQFHCFDCSSANCSTFLRRKDSSIVCLDEGMASCVCLCAIKIASPTEKLDTLDNLCSCGFAWVIWYNLAVVSIFLGTRLGEKGYGLLDQACKLFKKVQLRLDAEPSTSTAWSLLKLAVINNQACIHHALPTTKSREQCLDRFHRTLQDSIYLKGVQWDTFYLNSLVLRGHIFAPAA